MLPKTSSQEREINLRDYAQVVLRRKWIVIVSFIVSLTIVTFYSFKATPVYQATTTVMIDKENPNVVSFEEVLSIDNKDLMFYQTQYDIMASRSLALRVINLLKLKDSPEFKPDEESEGFSPGSFLRSLFKKEAAGSVNSNEAQSELITGYLERLKVTPIRNSRLVKISFSGHDPEIVTKIINRHAEEYITRNLEVRFAASHDAVEWLQKQVLTKRAKVEDAENALQLYKEKEQLISAEDRQNIIVQKLEELNTTLTQARTERMGLETLYNLIQESKGKPQLLESLPEVMDSKLIQDLKKEYVRLCAENSKLSQKYGRNHPVKIRADAQEKEMYDRIATEVGRIAESIETRYKVAKSKEESLSLALEEQKTVALELNRKSITYGTLKRASEAERSMYEILLKRLKEADVTGDLQTSNITVVDPAEIPTNPIKPKKKLNVLLGMIVGLGLGVGLAFFLEYLDNTVKSPEDIEHYLNISLLGVLEHVRVQSDGRKSFAEVITHDMPRSVFAEAVRSIRTSVMFSIIGKSKKLIMVTSAVQGEGKTFVASNLAAAIAQTDKKVLLVDTDLRKPRVNKVFGIEKNPGLCNHLIGEIDLESIIKPTRIPNVSIITCGNIPPNPSEIMHSTVMETFCDNVRERFDMILFDSPPSMTVTDAIVLSRLMDGVILVIKSGVAPRETIRRCLSQIAGNKGEVLGAIINSVNISKGGYYYHYYAHYYKYGYSSEKEMEEAEKTV